MVETLLAVALCTVAATLCYHHLHLRRAHNKGLPPGPPGAFIAGNAFQIPRSEPWVWCGQLKEKYGELQWLSLLVFP